MKDVTLEMLIDAARRIGRQRDWFTVRDLWYELGNVTTRGKRYNRYDFRKMEQLIRQLPVKKQNETDHNGRTRYVLLED